MRSATRTALVTGASSGLGKQIALVLRYEGWNVLGTKFPDSEGEDLFPCDFEDMGQVQDLAFWVHSKLQDPCELDLLVNNAGINCLMVFEDSVHSHIEKVMRVNFVAPVQLVRLLLPLLQRARGTVCNVVSDASYRPMRHSLAYNCSKAALAMATKQMARELTKSKGITVFSVNPGKMKNTKMSDEIDVRVQTLRGWTPEEAKTYFQQASVTGEESSPYLVAQHIANLVHNREAVRMLSGACIDLVG